jgi:hypothetical protein
MIRRTGIFSMIVLSVFLFCGQTAPQQCNTQTNSSPDHLEAEVLGTGIAVVAAITITTIVLVHNAHHRLTGCVYTAPEGTMLVTSSDGKKFLLQGATTDLKVGDRVKVHGSHAKQNKADKGDPIFVVEKINKDYGSCKTAVPVTAAE